MDLKVCNRAKVRNPPFVTELREGHIGYKGLRPAVAGHREAHDESSEAQWLLRAQTDQSCDAAMSALRSHEELGS